MSVFLKAMTLEGFKTFARRTEIDFQAGLTAIVGPNGSGKTNIIDAFKWVLGETNARDLRGSRMEDVIYSGGLRRSRAPKAQVTLLLDNSEGGLPVDYSEVAITRRVSRSGQSDFFLNGTRVRRRDVLELLQSTGLTIDSYALVNQSNIESIVTSTPAERRGLIEEAAAIRGVKTRRLEAAGQLQALAANVDRLSDLRGEIEPRLELVRIQAEAARKAAVATERLDLLRGSIAWEEWREAKESHRRAESQIGSLRRRLVEAQAAAVIAEDRFQVARRELTAAQGRQVAHQERLGTLRVKLSQAEHGLALARERISGQEALAAAAEQEDTQRELRLEAVATEASALRGDLDRGRAALAAVPQPPNPPPLPTAEESRAAHRKADAARQAHTAASNQLVSIRARRELLEQNAKALAADLDQALSQLGDAEAAAAQATAEALAIREKASRLRSARAELEGLRALVVTPAEGLRRLGEVVVANPGYEAAVSAVLGPFIDAWVAPDESAANQFVDPTSPQRTIFYPAGESSLLAQCLLEHVRVEPGYESIAQSFLGDVVVAVEGKVSVSLSGIYRRPGMVRAGDDPRARLDARRRLLADEVAALELKSVPEADSVNAARQAEAVVAGLRSRVGARQRLEQMTGELDLVRKHESTLAGGLEELESAAARAEESSRSLSQALDLSLAQAAEHRAEVQRLDQERSRWRERCADLERRLQGLDQEHRVGIEARAQRTRRREAATARAQEAAASLVGLEDDLTAARAALKVAEQDLPDQAAELAGMAKGLVAIEEARVDARLRVGGLDSELALRLKDAELAMARLDEVKARMPEGRAPEEVPGGKAREREIRLLERELVDIGPTNPLAEAELADLDQRFGTLIEQLDDIARARGDLDQLVAQLRGEESTRYESVFGAVAANFQEFFSVLSGGGRATLRAVSGGEGADTGVELLVQPPRKRLQTITLLSSGERSIAALALVLALEEVNPSPFTILDEVDAALDDGNVGRYVELLQRMGRQRQFLVVTHNYRTMAGASALYGVHLDESGCSHLVSARLEDIRETRLVEETAASA